jgi:uncharacterized protein (DUF1499 family)
MNRTVAIISGCALALVALSCSGTRPANLGMKDGRLAPCPQSPNCVSTFAADSMHAITTIPYTGTIEEAKQKLVSVINSLPRAKIITNTNNYVYAEFTSATWRFVDDVEFFFDDSAKVVQFRSASRLGYGDIGVNRKRMETIRSKFAGTH